jgi:hypothetical protein
MTGLSMYTVYDRPRDFPRHIVVREFICDAGGARPKPFACLYDSLQDVRREMRARALFCMPRAPEDDPKIVEVWL